MNFSCGNRNAACFPHHPPDRAAKPSGKKRRFRRNCLPWHLTKGHLPSRLEHLSSSPPVPRYVGSAKKWGQVDSARFTSVHPTKPALRLASRRVPFPASPLSRFVADGIRAGFLRRTLVPGPARRTLAAPCVTGHRYPEWTCISCGSKQPPWYAGIRYSAQRRPFVLARATIDGFRPPIAVHAHCQGSYGRRLQNRILPSNPLSATDAFALASSTGLSTFRLPRRMGEAGACSTLPGFSVRNVCSAAITIQKQGETIFPSYG